MPELPEVEVSRLGIAPHLEGQTISRVIVRDARLRWPVPETIQQASGSEILAVNRRAKYLLIQLSNQAVIVLHLGMSGKLRVLPATTPPVKHDHIDIVLANGICLRLNDPRRFGACLYQQPGDAPIKLLANLGPEPLTEDFDAQRLITLSKGKQVAVKNFIMDNAVVVGVGNIYANEALFKAGILPTKPAKQVTDTQLARLLPVIKETLTAAIKQGGTTLKDFSQADGKPGYFAQQLLVYGRGGQPCVSCGKDLTEIRLGQRSTVFCASCQQ